jgi:hypothetical protein
MLPLLNILRFLALVEVVSIQITKNALMALRLIPLLVIQTVPVNAIL